MIFDLMLSNLCCSGYGIIANFFFWLNLHILFLMLNCQVFLNISHFTMGLSLYFSFIFHTWLTSFVLFLCLASLKEDLWLLAIMLYSEQHKLFNRRLDTMQTCKEIPTSKLQTWGKYLNNISIFYLLFTSFFLPFTKSAMIYIRVSCDGISNFTAWWYLIARNHCSRKVGFPNISCYIYLISSRWKVIFVAHYNFNNVFYFIFLK